MKQTITVILTLITFLSFGQSNYDTSNVTIIPLDTTQNWSWHLKNNKTTSLTLSQINLVDSILNVCISQNNNNGKPTNTFGIYIGIHSFKRQFVPSVNDKGEIVIWANCFCESFIKLEPETKKEKRNGYGSMTLTGDIDWRKNIFVIHDGGVGGCFFNVKINLTTKKYSDLYVNGM